MPAKEQVVIRRYRVAVVSPIVYFMGSLKGIRDVGLLFSL
jgi:hypothetical protein